MITENKITIIIIALIGFIIYTILRNIKESKKFDEDYNKLLADKRYKVKGQYS